MEFSVDQLDDGHTASLAERPEACLRAQAAAQASANAWRFAVRSCGAPGARPSMR